MPEENEKVEKSKNRKIVWTVLFWVLLVILIYMSVVLYFFYGSPYDISLKLKLWPLLTNQSVGELYTDAIVEVDFSANVDGLDVQDVTANGVNVRIDGYILVAYQDMNYYEITSDISIVTNSGAVYSGEIIFSDEAYGIVVIKCIDDTGAEIKLPYVNIYGDAMSEGTTLISVNYSRTDGLQVLAGTATGEYYLGYETSDPNDPDDLSKTDGYVAVLYTMQECFTYEVDAATKAGSVVFDRKGNLMGLFSSYAENGDVGMAISTTYIAALMDDIVANYQETGTAFESDLVNALSALDALEVYVHYETAKDTDGYHYYNDDQWCGCYYYNGEWKELTDHMEYICGGYNPYYAWLYLVEDFTYDGQTIAANNILMSYEVNGGGECTIYSRIQLVEVFYNLRSGDTIKLNYESYNEQEGQEEIASIEITLS